MLRDNIVVVAYKTSLLIYEKTVKYAMELNHQPIGRIGTCLHTSSCLPLLELYATSDRITYHTGFPSLGRIIVMAVQMLRDHQARDVGRRQAASA